MWRARLSAESEMETSKRKAWEQERDKLLQQRQQRPDPRQQQQHLQTIHDLKTSHFQRFGVRPSPVADKYFVENYKALDRIAQQGGQRKTIEQLAQEAAQATAEQLGDMGAQYVGAPAPANTNGNGARPAQAAITPAQQTLPARPAAAPTTAAPTIPIGGTADDFMKRMKAIQGMGQRR
jgi:hypothetical protein